MYKIVRFYYPSPHTGYSRRPRTIKRGLTLEQAQAHCKDPNTREEGKWFDGYTED